MTDYYAVLKKAVGGLEHEAGDVRRAVYDKARTALIGQLKSIDPPLTTSEISRQRLELEEAIRKVEREATVTAAGPVPARARAAAAVAEALAHAEPEPEAELEPEADYAPPYEEEPPAPPPRQPVRPQVPVRPPPNARVAPPPVEPVDAEYEEDEPADAPAAWVPSPVPAPKPIQVNPRPAQERPPQERPAPRVPQPEPQEAPPQRGRQPVRREPPPFVAEPQFEPEADAEPPMEESRDYEARPEWPRQGYEDVPVLDHGFADEQPERAQRRGKRARARDDGYGERPRRSRWPTLILLIIVGLIIGGIAALAWSQRTAVKDVIGDLINSIDEAGGKPALSEAPAASDPASEKNGDRLGDAPEEAPKSVRSVDVPPADGVEGDPLSGVVPPQTEAPPADSSAAPADAAPADAAPAPAAPGPATDAAPAAPDATAMAAPAGGGGAAAVAPAGDDALVAQKAILYEQPAEGAQNVTALNATVTWRFDPNSANGPEIQAQVDVPDRKMKVTVNIRKNTDSALPASHLVEVIIDTPADFPGGGVKSVPAFVMKPTEEARGQPLDGAAAKVADGFFWIAFASDAQPMAQNLALLKERDWIDIPLVYQNDQRAILTLEKGTPGQRVFEKALAAWGN